MASWIGIQRVHLKVFERFGIQSKSMQYSNTIREYGPDGNNELLERAKDFCRK